MNNIPVLKEFYFNGIFCIKKNERMLIMKERFLVIFLVLILFSVSALSSCTKREPQPVQNMPQMPVNPHATTTATPEKVGPPTVLPKDKTPEEWVKEYYEAYKKGDFEKAYSYLPAVSKARETTENFKASRSTMPITSFEIGNPVETKEGTATLVKIPVRLDSSGMEFETTWIFEKRPDGTFIARETRTAIGSQ
jgi:hypothetical protein